jgi:hypothetical protein
MYFNYDETDWRLIARVLDENSARLSRTRAGVSDTSTSDGKRKLLLEGKALRRRCAANEGRVCRLLFAARHEPPPQSPADVLELLWRIADTMNDGLVRPGDRLRQWPSYAEVPAGAGLPARRVARRAPAELPAALERFTGDVHRRWGELAGDPVPLASWAEWELNGGSLHPFYDGCGRSARAFGALLLVRGSWLPPVYEDVGTYFDHGHRGEQAFAAYVRQRIAACALWLGLGGAAPPIVP